MIRNYNEILSQMDEKMHHLLDLSATRNRESRKMCYKIKKVFEYLEKLEVRTSGQADFSKYLNLGRLDQDFRRWSRTCKSVRTSDAHWKPFDSRTGEDRVKATKKSTRTCRRLSRSREST